MPEEDEVIDEAALRVPEGIDFGDFRQFQWRPREFVSTSTKIRANVENITELQKLEKEVREGNFNNASLRLSIKVAGASATLDRIRIASRGTANVVNCSDCVLTCFANTVRSAYGGMRWVCPECLSSYVYCKECNSFILSNDNLLHFHAPDLVRLRQENRVERFDANVMAGNRKPRTTTRSKPRWNPTRYFGVEIELERRQDIIVPPDMILKAKYSLATGFGVIKHDGSLRAAPGNMQNGTNGFEVVSLPGTMEYHRTLANWHNFFEVMTPWMEASPSTTGLHVHVSAASMTRATIGKMIKFVNSPNNLAFMKLIADRDFTKANPNGRYYANVYPNVDEKVKELISRRQHSEGCQNSPLERIIRCYYRDDNKLVKYDLYGHPIIQRIDGSLNKIATCQCPEGNYDYEGHYAALNVATHKPTVELRMFQGSTNESHFWAALEFTDALVEFCEAHNFNDLHWQQFISWFKEHRYLYKGLARWLVVGGLIEPLKKKES